jgi:hypothetical protein
VNVVNLLAGLGVVAVTGSTLVQNLALITVAGGILFVVLLAAPRLLPRVAHWIGRLAGREVAIPKLSDTTIWLVVVASVVAWVVYGIAFWLLVQGIVSDAAGPVASYIGVFTASYVIGYVTLLAPGGLFVREAALIAFLEQLNLTTGGAGMIIAVASRLWLTLLEVIPGSLYLLYGARPTTTRTSVGE